MDTRTTWSLYIIVSLICSLITLGVYLDWQQKQEEKAKQARQESERQSLEDSIKRIGVVELEPKDMNYGRLKGLLQDQGVISPTKDYKNAVTIRWYGGIVEAVFLNDSLPSDSEKPVEIKTYDFSTQGNFQGVIRGIRFGDSKERVAASMRQFGCRITELGEYDMNADCDDNWAMRLSLSDGKIKGISVRDKRYISSPFFIPLPR